MRASAALLAALLAAGAAAAAQPSTPAPGPAASPVAPGPVSPATGPAGAVSPSTGPTGAVSPPRSALPTALVRPAATSQPAPALSPAELRAALGSGVSVSRLPAGGTVIVEPTGGSPVAAVELWYRAPSTGFGSTARPSVARLAAQAVAASKPLVGQTLGSLVANAGGRLAISVYPDSVEIAALVPASVATRIVRAMTTAYFAPVLTSDGLLAAKKDVMQEAVIESFNPETLVRDAVFAQLFSAGPQHFAPLGDPHQVYELSEGDVRAFATRAFRSQNAILVVTGNIPAGIGAAAAVGRPAAADAGAEGYAARQLAAAPYEPAQRTFDLPSGGYGWTGPRIADEREATALDFLADYLFHAESGIVSRRLASSPDAFALGQFITLHDPGVFFVAYAGKKIDAVRAAVDRGLASVHTPLPPAAFAAARLTFEYNLLHDLQTPTELADNFGWYDVEGNPGYAPGAGGRSGAYFRAAESLTPEFVAATADKYLNAAPALVNLRPQPEPEKTK
jgi:hypothetical protein